MVPTLRAVILAFVLGALAPLPGRAEPYLLQPGDVLSVRIMGPGDLQVEVPIEIDGTAWFPIIGGSQVAGATLGEIRDRISASYAATRFPTASTAGGVSDLIQPNQVYIGVAQYQPVYLSGDILLPGTVDYRPGLTVRQALVQIGANAVEEGTDAVLGEQIEAAELSLAGTRARIWSLKTRLGTATEADYEAIFVAPTESITRIAEIERDRVQAEQAERERLARTIDAGITRAESRLDALTRQRASEDESRQLDDDIVDDLRDLNDQGLAPTTRLSAVRRAALASASGVLELDATIEEVRSELTEQRAAAETLGTVTRSETLATLSDTMREAQDLRAELADLRRARTTAGTRGETMVAIITRRGEALPAIDLEAADADLRPGDLVEIVRRPLDGPRQSGF